MSSLPEDNINYKELLNLLNKSDPKDVYEELIKKEDKILDTINRVVNYSNEKELKDSEFMNKTITQHIYGLFWTIKGIMGEFYRIKTFQDAKQIFTKDDRIIYIGILLLCIAFFLFFVINSS
jgi:hypothetical protein